MRVAITVDPYIPVPPDLYGGIERVVDFLVRGLMERGHDVTLFAHPDSRTQARLIGYGAPPHFGALRRLREIVQVGARLLSMSREIDLVHSFGRLAALLPVLPLRSLPKIQSYQRDLLPERGIRRALRLSGTSLRFTACATHMYANRDVSGSWSTVYNGVDLDKYAFVPRVAPDAPLVFLGRLERIKGAHHAVTIARRSGRGLLLAGNVVRSGPDASYFDDEILPAVDDVRVRYVGPVDDGAKNALLGQAAALLMPIEWEEPFGIVQVEAMACGTPVVAFARGSAPEVVRDGVNGYLCRGIDDAVGAVGRIGELSRRDVRADAESRFGAPAIVDAYESLYQVALAESERR